MSVGWDPLAGRPTIPAGPDTFSGDGLACLPVLPARLRLGAEAAWRAPLAAAAFVASYGSRSII